VFKLSKNTEGFMVEGGKDMRLDKIFIAFWGLNYSKITNGCRFLQLITQAGINLLFLIGVLGSEGVMDKKIKTYLL
jgi:hypothetical protein